ncbi:FAD/NAD(P)-binding domain-containing protein [Aspergillus eucalypticola CBS 122712]|uniref:FAD/NAD(P)-binding domain-containing protein n=1 Tax=Aspergillus eucalypticola (strain CBS 122712 / IBT 29274) TaxID=1448314 RepID=A0A317VMS3_ASPEC|nr:FAD/NAD(P)-binding domain-containing protein [Aspergillus eucalypticola CBS 122712]PWY74142.1 FAD/NAD(P)-binding domain-containing protein [Aspergillus eucalypticola CBS 122712]
MTSQPNTITIPIIGASIAGLTIAHSLLSHFSTTNHTTNSTTKIKILLINPHPSFYWAIAAPRILTKPTAFTESQYLIPIADGFAKYSPDVFEFILGRATSLDFEKKLLNVEEVTDTESNKTLRQEIKYDYLVIASGSTPSASSTETLFPGEDNKDGENGEIYPFKLSPTSTTTITEAIKSAQTTISTAKKITVIGAGPIGVEIAGELGDLISSSPSEEGEEKKVITLISSTPRILPTLKPSASETATSLLSKKGVRVLTDRKVISVSPKEEGGYEIKLNNGDTLETDIYIPTIGVLPNSSYIPREVLDERGWVRVDEELKVSGVEGVYAAGDITTHTQKLSFKADEMAGVVVGNLVDDINHATGAGNGNGSRKKGWRRGCGGGGGRKTYDEGTDVMMVVPVGTSGGTGQAFGWVLVSFMVWLAKGRDYFIWKAKGYVFK